MPSCNSQVAKIESERLLGALVETELAKRKGYTSAFAAQFHYFGYEGRCPPPTNFDCNYCAALGLTAGALIASGYSGMMACLGGLTKPPEEWAVRGVPLTSMLCIERRKGKLKPVIRKALVELGAPPFSSFKRRRAEWLGQESFSQPGPAQFDGATAFDLTHTLRLERGALAVDAADDGATKLRRIRCGHTPSLPAPLANGALRVLHGEVPVASADDEFVREALPATYGAPRLELVTGDDGQRRGSLVDVSPALRIGVVFCGRQCPGAHNVVAGIWRFLRERAGPKAALYGFVGGTAGLFAGEARELKEADVNEFLNAGGMALLRRTSDAIRSEAQRAAAVASCTRLNLDGLVLVGGCTTNSDTAILAEHFAAASVRTKVVGVPASIDGDLLGAQLEASIGFDTACRVYAGIIGNLATDAASARKYWYFVRIMGRSPSHITLECAHLTRPNVVLIGEEIEAKRGSLASVVAEITDAVEARAAAGKHFGTVLIPEGLVEYIPEVHELLNEISAARRSGHESDEGIAGFLTPWSAALLQSMPEFIRRQLSLSAQARVRPRPYLGPSVPPTADAPARLLEAPARGAPRGSHAQGADAFPRAGV